ncbi:ankyrin repeat domain-containing protein SOWAHD [Eudromia elegans]
MARREDEAAARDPAPGAALASALRGGSPGIHRVSRRLQGGESRGSGSWSRASARLSIGPGSSRRKELKEILLQSNGPGSGAWLAAAQRLSDLPAGPPPPPEPSPEELSLALDPLEHEWLLTAAQGDEEGILRLLELEPGLLARKDFVTGFTALHWLAKHGRHESLIRVVALARSRGYDVDVDVAAGSGGLTPLHLAALQGHEMLIKVLVGAYGADASRRDHSGRRAWQYLLAGASRELKELAGALEEDLAQLGAHNANNNCKSSHEAGAGAGRRAELETHGRPRRLRSLRGFIQQALAFFQER